jgi:hypothetical protein
LKLNTVLFAIGHVITVENIESLQKASHTLIKIVKGYNLTMSAKKTKVKALKENTL